MKKVYYEDAWEELKNANQESSLFYETAEDVSRIIVELLEARVDKGYSQRQLASICGLKQSAIARMESLKTIPRLDTVVRVAKALDISLSVNRVSAQIIGIDSYISTNKSSGKANYTDYILKTSGNTFYNSGATYEFVG